MPTYYELLQRPEWKSLRQELLFDRKWKCQCCSNGNIESLERLKFHSVRRYTESRITQENGLHCFIIEMCRPVTIHGKELNMLISAFFWTELEDFFERQKFDTGTSVIYSTEEDSHGKKHNRIAGFKNDDEWIFVSNIHIHHPYYKEGLTPWEYPKKDLEVLCWVCHEKLHENTYVPCYDCDGNLTGQLSPCWKCFGSGYLPQYHYYMGGMCFACDGKRFR